MSEDTPAKPFQPTNAPEPPSFRVRGRSAVVAIEKPDLASTIDASPGIKPAQLSIFLQLALHVHSQGFGPDFTGPKKAVRKALAGAASQFNVTLTTRQEEYLATFLRNPEAQKGKNRGR